MQSLQTNHFQVEFSLRLDKYTGCLTERLYYLTGWGQTVEFANLQTSFRDRNKGREYTHLGTRIIWFRADLELYVALYSCYPSQSLERRLQTEMFLSQMRQSA